MLKCSSKSYPSDCIDNNNVLLYWIRTVYGIYKTKLYGVIKKSFFFELMSSNAVDNRYVPKGGDCSG